MPPPVTGSTLAALLRERVTELEAACAGVDETASGKRPKTDAWCIREHLSHLHGDDRDTFLDGIRGVLVEGVAELDVTPGITHYTVDRRDAGFPALLRTVCEQYRAIADLAEAMTTEQLEHRTRIELMEQSPFGSTPKMSEWLGAIADMHLSGHIAQIRETRTATGA
jgi:hypothetical protein